MGFSCVDKLRDPVHKGEVRKSCGGEAVWVACSGQVIFCTEIKECGWAKQAKAASRDDLQKNPVRRMLSARGERDGVTACRRNKIGACPALG